MNDPLGRPGTKYYYDVIPICEVEPLGEGDMIRLSEAGKKGFRVTGIYRDNKHGDCMLIEMAYNDGEPDGSWLDIPPIPKQHNPL